MSTSSPSDSRPRKGAQKCIWKLQNGNTDITEYSTEFKWHVNLNLQILRTKEDGTSTCAFAGEPCEFTWGFVISIAFAEMCRSVHIDCARAALLHGNGCSRKFHPPRTRYLETGLFGFLLFAMGVVFGNLGFKCPCSSKSTCRGAHLPDALEAARSPKPFEVDMFITITASDGQNGEILVYVLRGNSQTSKCYYKHSPFPLSRKPFEKTLTPKCPQPKFPKL